MPTHRTTLSSILLAVVLTAPAAAQTKTVARASSSPPVEGTRWVIDPVHSQLGFRVRHLVGSVHGTFRHWYGVIVTRETGWQHGTVNVSAQTKSLDTGNTYRDADLRSDRFFAVERFPQLTFESTGIVATDSTVEIGGILTMKGRSRHVVLAGRYGGQAKDREGHQRIGFEARTVVDRRDYGISLEELGNTVGNDVEIVVSLEAVRVN